ncbi:CDP-diacylglycerol--glycerol-3-phosphate 3-phosphatidyltransferase [Deltaproteobacteria bacterium]|nr:CDP-diacylglycerol--glycerol-3-phosphate 3-phosphatidyltransferase [Deltaproteobacteria bacterium]
MRLLNLPNKITLSRILIVPIIILLLYYANKITCLFACICFIIASATDLIDGIIARRTNMVTRFGKFLDPLADKVLISSVLIMLVYLHDPDGTPWVHAWIAIVVICRELLITGLRAIAADNGVVIAADRFGKWKTILQSCALAPLILHYPWFGLNPVPLGQFLLYIAVALTVFSGANYLYTFHRHWLGHIQNDLDNETQDCDRKTEKGIETDG